MHLKFTEGSGYDVKYYSVNEGFMGDSPERLSVTKDQNGVIIVGTSEGKLDIKPNDYKGVKRDLNVYLNAVVNENNQKGGWAKYCDSIVDGVPFGLKLPYRMNHLTFQYKAYHLKCPNEVKYKVTFIGDEEKTIETKKTEKDFDNSHIFG